VTSFRFSQPKIRTQEGMASVIAVSLTLSRGVFLQVPHLDPAPPPWTPSQEAPPRRQAYLGTWDMLNTTKMARHIAVCFLVTSCLCHYLSTFGDVAFTLFACDGRSWLDFPFIIIRPCVISRLLVVHGNSVCDFNLFAITFGTQSRVKQKDI
jgi:hypothetical protein